MFSCSLQYNQQEIQPNSLRRHHLLSQLFSLSPYLLACHPRSLHYNLPLCQLANQHQLLRCNHLSILVHNHTVFLRRSQPNSLQNNHLEYRLPSLLNSLHESQPVSRLLNLLAYLLYNHPLNQADNLHQNHQNNQHLIPRIGPLINLHHSLPVNQLGNRQYLRHFNR